MEITKIKTFADLLRWGTYSNPEDPDHRARVAWAQEARSRRAQWEHEHALGTLEAAGVAF